MATPRFATPSEDGVWRVARGPDPFELLPPPPPLFPPEMPDPATGNRFDSALGNYRVWYFATQLEGCYGEVLAPLRPDPGLAKLIGDDWRGFMDPGDIPADWRSRRIAVRARFPEAREFLDVEAVETRQVLRTQLSWVFDRLKIEDCDVAAVRGGDRRLTRWISQWAHDYPRHTGGTPLAGIRFLSRHDSAWECWAVFDDADVEELERRSILVQDDALRRVADLYDLNVY